MTSTTKDPKAHPSLVRLETRTPAIGFGAAKSLPYTKRIVWIVALVVVGVGLQVVFLRAWFGLPFLLAAVVLTWVRGFDEQLDRRRPKMKADWEETEVGRIAGILEHDRAMRSWDTSLTDISSGPGAFLFVLVLAAIAAAYLLLRATWPQLAWIVALDGLLLFVPQWFNGMRFIQTRGDLVLKAKHTKEVLDGIAKDRFGAGVAKARLYMVGPKEQRVPENLKLVVGYPDGPKGFHGVQAQVVINRVQGTGYPYFYACIVAQEGLDLLAKGTPKRLPDDVIQETQTKDGVDVIVIRQRTTRTSGYHTKVPQSRAILETALDAAAAFAAGSA